MKTKPPLKISFIGSGKVATSLAETLFRNGFTISEITGKNYSHSLALAKKVKAVAVKKTEELSESDFIIMAVNDDNISSVSKKITTKNSIVLHTSGTADLRLLSKHAQSGVLYPLQTFTAGKSIWLKKTPLLIEGSDAKTRKKIKLLAHKISDQVTVINSEKRLKIHFAAVLVSNFTNHLYFQANKILKQEKIPFTILMPLIESVTKNLSLSPPEKNQTGPAIRRDQKTIKKHEAMIKSDPGLLKIYRDISKSIQVSHPLKQK